MVTVGTVKALTLLSTIQAVPLALAPVGTHTSGVSGRTYTLTRLRVAASSVLAAAIRPALISVFSLWTFLGTQWSRETRRTVALARNGIAFPSVTTLALFRAVLSETIRLALELAE